MHDVGNEVFSTGDMSTPVLTFYGSEFEESVCRCQTLKNTRHYGMNLLQSTTSSTIYKSSGDCSSIDTLEKFRKTLSDVASTSSTNLEKPSNKLLSMITDFPTTSLTYKKIKDGHGELFNFTNNESKDSTTGGKKSVI